ncbi:hypothetical protein NL676_030618 [Syzygium grande]|nr:hypothetical protein NL676_030618 [Syzygium grande]
MISADRSRETLTTLLALASPQREVKASEAIQALFFTTQVFDEISNTSTTSVSFWVRAKPPSFPLSFPPSACFPSLFSQFPHTASSTEADPLRTMLVVVIDTWMRNGPRERASRHPIARRIGALHLLLYIESDELHQESPEHARSFQLDSVPRHHSRTLPKETRFCVPSLCARSFRRGFVS